MSSQHDIPKQIEAIPYLPEADSFDFKNSIDSLKATISSHLLLIFVTTALTVGLVVAYIFVWPPVFQASVTVSADSDNDLQRDTFYQQWNIFRKEAVSDEAVLMTSDPILRLVIVELDLKYDEVYHPFMSHVIHLWGKSWIGRNYRKIKYKIFPKPPLPEGLTEAMVERGKILKDFRSAVGLVPIGEANIALLRVRGPTPRVAEIANKIIDVYLQERRKRYVDEARAARDTLLKATEQAYTRLHVVESELQKFYSDNSLLLSFEKDRLQMNQWLGVQAELRELETHEVQLLKTLESLGEQLKDESVDLDSVSLFHENIVGMEQNLTQLKYQLRVELQKYQADAPEIRDLQDQISALEAVIKQQQTKLKQQGSKSQNKLYETLRAQIGIVESELAGVRAAIINKRASVGEFKRMMDQIPKKMLQTNQLLREQALLEGQYKVLNEKLVQASVSMASAESAPSSIRIVDYSTPPEKPIWPRTKPMLLAALILGGLLGMVIALLLDIIFIRANRKKLTSNGKYTLYAELGQDPAFIRALYSRRT